MQLKATGARSWQYTMLLFPVAWQQLTWNQCRLKVAAPGLKHTPTHRPIWVMEVDGSSLTHPATSIAGWLSFQSFLGRQAYQATAEISIYVAPAYQGCGVGRQLLTQAILQSPSLGVKTLVGFIFAHNQPSLRLFGALGFQRWGYLSKVAEIDGVERDLVIVGRRITNCEAFP